MGTVTARPGLLKQANLSAVRSVIRARGTATRSEIVDETRISSTTVRSLLSELVQNGELESAGYDESSGGRKAERYRFTPDRYYCAAFCITVSEVHALLINIYGEVVSVTRLEVAAGDLEGTIAAFLDDLLTRKTIKSIGIGAPGVVEGGGFWKKRCSGDLKRVDMGVSPVRDRREEELYRVDIGDALSRRYGLPVVMENDMNATAIGFGHCYEKEFPSEDPERTNMAYLHFERGCVSAGFIAEGRILRGCHNFAGELGLVPLEDGGLLDACMARPMDDALYIKCVIQIICWVCGILNPQYIALGGPDLRKDCIGPIGDGLYSLLPGQMLAELLYAPDVWHDYYDGMACLTTAKMFDEVQFICHSHTES